MDTAAPRIQRARSQWARLGRFVIVGLVNSLAYTIAVWCLISQVGLSYTTASVVGYLAAVPTAFFAHRVFTFASNGAVPLEMFRFASVHALGLAVSWAVMDIVSNRLGMHYAVGMLAVVLAVPLVSFFVFDRFVFRRET